MTCSRCGLEIEAGEMAWHMGLVAQHAKCDVCAIRLKERIAALDAENSALREDKARLDWLDSCIDSLCLTNGIVMGRLPNGGLRARIDAARKGGK